MVKVILDDGVEHEPDCPELATGVLELRRLVAEAELDDLAARSDIPRVQIETVARGFAQATGAMVVTRNPHRDVTWRAPSPSGWATCSA